MTAIFATAATPRAKSPDAFRTISEVAMELDVPQHVLRFWESRFGQVRPVKRAGGRRYYRPEDVDLLRGIRSLLYSDGFTIKGVQKLLREQGIRYVAEIGRGETSLHAQSDNAGDDFDSDADASPLAALTRVHADAVMTLDEERRVQLELLLAELLVLKGRVRASLSRHQT
ncbi:MAG TPA: MerR family transcriptional regulator [Rhizomicrobium sp.]|nr:MerR family transcriptional regulator [Rhizomicrobium sp.]